MEVEELKVLISAESNKFQAEINKVQDQLKSFGQLVPNVGNSISTNITGNLFKMNLAANLATQGIMVVASTIKNVFAGIGNAIFSVTQKIWENGTAYSRIKVATNVVARNIGLTTEEVNKLRDSLAEANTFGIQAEEVIKSLAMSGLIDLSRELKNTDARTGETIQGVEALVLSMKDLSAAAGIDSAEGISRLTRFIQRGEASFADGLFELGNLNKEYKDFAQSIGKTREELTAQEEAQARMNIVIRESQKAFGAYAMTMQSAGKLMSSISQKMNQIFATVGDSLSPLFDTFANGLYQLVSAFYSAIAGASNSIKNWATEIASYIVVAFRIIGSVLSRIPIYGKYFQGLASFSMKTIPALKGVAGGVSSLGSAMDESADGAGKLKKQLAGLAGFDEMNVLKLAEDSSGSGSGAGVTSGGIADVGDAGGSMLSEFDADTINSKADEIMNGITDKINFIKLKWQEFTEPIKQFWSDLLLFMQPVFDWINTNIMPVFGQIGAVIIEAWNFLISKSPEVVTALQPLTDSIGKYLTEAFAWLSEVIDYLWKNILKPLIDFIVANFMPVFKVVVDIVIKLIGVFSEWASKIIDTFMPVTKFLWEAFKFAFETIRSVVEFTVNNILLPLFRNIYSFVTGFIIPVFNTLKAVFTIVWSAIASVAKWAWDQILNAIMPVVNWIMSIVMPIFEKVKAQFISVWVAVGDTVRNVWNGIKSSVIWGINSVIGLLNDFIYRINQGLEGASQLAQSIPGGQAITYRVGYLPRLAKGGIVKEDTLAMLHKGSNEAVLPLEGNNDWISELAEKINGSGNGQSIQVVVKLGEDTVYEKLIDYVNDKTMISNTNLLNI